jgi:hypothetical protein
MAGGLGRTCGRRVRSSLTGLPSRLVGAGCRGVGAGGVAGLQSLGQQDLDPGGDWDRHRGRYAAESLGVADALPVFHYQQALLDFWRGRLDDALAELDTRSRLVEQMEIGWHLPAESLGALIAIHRDDLIAAGRHLAAAEREAAHGGSPHGIDLMALARARLLEASGDTEAALEAIASAVKASASAGTISFMPVLGPELSRLAAAVGDPGRAAVAIPAWTGSRGSIPALTASGPMRFWGMARSTATGTRSSPPPGSCATVGGPWRRHAWRRPSPH